MSPGMGMHMVSSLIAAGVRHFAFWQNDFEHIQHCRCPDGLVHEAPEYCQGGGS
jgi:hypothetical protein